MSDIQITCLQCGKENTVSEYAETVICRFCGGELPRKKPVSPPAAAAGVSQGRKLKLKKEEKPPEPRLEPGETPASFLPPPVIAAEDDQSRFAKQRIVTTKKKGWAAAAMPWVVFVAIAGVMYWLRYRGGLSAPQLETVKQYGPYLFLACHVVIILAAFKDQVFYGILCLLLPPYPYYYLLLVSDSFYLRAVLAGLYVGIGWDSLSFLNEHTKFIIDGVNRWIQSGGGPV
jgi:hypothetical protein